MFLQFKDILTLRLLPKLFCRPRDSSVLYSFWVCDDDDRLGIFVATATCDFVELIITVHLFKFCKKQENSEIVIFQLKKKK